jgi:NADH-ubiquinone oxidoreductase chain 2
MNSLFTSCLGKGIALYGGLFNVSVFSQVLIMFILTISIVILTLTGFFQKKIHIPRLSYKTYTSYHEKGEQFEIIEYALIIVFILCGAVFLVSSADLISIFLSIELQSYGLYIISTLYRDSELATGSGLTYFLLGGLSSCFILLGSALLYVNSGTTNLENIYVIISISTVENSLEVIESVGFYGSYYVYLSFIIMSVGLLFKVSAAPFHF